MLSFKGVVKCLDLFDRYLVLLGCLFLFEPFKKAPEAPLGLLDVFTDRRRSRKVRVCSLRVLSHVVFRLLGRPYESVSSVLGG